MLQLKHAQAITQVTLSGSCVLDRVATQTCPSDNLIFLFGCNFISSVATQTCPSDNYTMLLKHTFCRNSNMPKRLPYTILSKHTFCCNLNMPKAGLFSFRLFAHSNKEVVTGRSLGQQRVLNRKSKYSGTK